MDNGKGLSMGRLSTLWQRVILLSISFCLLSCASSSVFLPYPVQAQKFRQAIVSGSSDKLANDLQAKLRSADGLLYAQELMRIAQLNQDVSTSQAAADVAKGFYRQLDDRAIISASDISAKGVAVISNDNAIPYTGDAYERILLNLFQAFNYLSTAKLEAASVELRQAAIEQRRLENQNAQNSQTIAKESRKQQLNNQTWSGSPEFAAMQNATSGVGSSLLNAYVYFVSAILWEAQRDWNAALVDYKKAAALAPNNRYIRAGIQRADAGLVSAKAHLFIVYEQGFVANKQSFNLSLPSFEYDTYFSVSVPYYRARRTINRPSLQIQVDAQPAVNASMLSDISKLAIKSLEEDMPGIVLRQFLRAKSKFEMQQKIQKQNELGGFLASIYNIVSEQADLRSWLTLPDNVQNYYQPLELGKHSVVLTRANLSQTLQLNAEPGRSYLIRVVDTGSQFVVNQYSL